MTSYFMLLTGSYFLTQGVNIIEYQLIRNFSNICDWFVDKKLSIDFGENKTKSIFLAPLSKLNISYGSLKIKKYAEVIFLGCMLDESLTVESLALNVVSKVSTCLKLLYQKIAVILIKAITM